MVEPLTCQLCNTRALESYTEPILAGAAYFVFVYCGECQTWTTGLGAGCPSEDIRRAESGLAEAKLRQVLCGPITAFEAVEAGVLLAANVLSPQSITLPLGDYAEED